MILNNAIKQQASFRRYEQILQELNGYWENNLWNALDCPFYKKETKIKDTAIKFRESLNPRIRNECKYYFFKRLANSEIKLSTVWNNNSAFNRLQDFIITFYSGINSIIDIPYGRFSIHYKTYLIEHGKSNLTVKSYLQLYSRIYSFFMDWYDERNELEKDIWNVRKLSIDYNKSNCGYTLSFTSVPSSFRKLAKKYIEKRALIQESLSWGSAIQTMAKLQEFFKYIFIKYPNWQDLTQLSRGDIEDFINYLRISPMGGNSTHKGQAPSDNHIHRSLSVLETFIVYIQRYEWDEAPKKPAGLLIVPEDKPKLPPKASNKIKYISDSIWDQIMNHMEKLPREIIPIVILLEATGFRISDVCTLGVDCLIQRKDGWWIIGDQRKVKAKNHRVPISEEISRVVLSQQKLTKEKSTSETNPLNYLFPTYHGTRKGLPISRDNVVNNLNKLAMDNNIVDEKGGIYRCKAHAFRHRYGVNLINNGMNILHVQKLMAHASPEMTLVYAQIHDTTIRKEWEKAISNGSVRLNPVGSIIATSIEKQADENGLELEWLRHNLDSIRLDHGFCIKSPKNNCDFLEQTLEPPCIKNNCRSFHVDQTFLDFYNAQILKMESDIDIYQKTGRKRSIEIIQPKLKKYKEIRDGIINNGGIYGLPKNRREIRD